MQRNRPLKRMLPRPLQPSLLQSEIPLRRPLPPRPRTRCIGLRLARPSSEDLLLLFVVILRRRRRICFSSSPPQKTRESPPFCPEALHNSWSKHHRSPNLTCPNGRLCAISTGGAGQPQLRQCSVTGPLKGCSPVPFSRACFNAKYHFAGLSASSISISPGLNRSPSACSIIVC
jgi:hypothetical protein